MCIYIKKSDRKGVTEAPRITTKIGLAQARSPELGPDQG